MRRLLGIILTSLFCAQSLSAEEEIFLWKNPGGDPCNPKICTLEWALSKIEWPMEVKIKLQNLVATTTPLEITLESGWMGWMTYGTHVAKFEPIVKADWGEGHTELSSLWTVDYENQRYNLVRVSICKNWGGSISDIPPENTISNSKQIDRPPLGRIPVVTCLS